MLKRIRKLSKQKASGKEEEELVGKSKPGPDQKELKDSPEMTVLINERERLQEEVKSLKEQLKNEDIRFTELKALKSRQVCALTFKLAKAVRDKEKALEENEILKQELMINRIKTTRQDGEVGNDSVCHREEALDMTDVKNDIISLTDASQLPKEDVDEASISLQKSTIDEMEVTEGSHDNKKSYFVDTGEPIQCIDNSTIIIKETIPKEGVRDLVEVSCLGGEPREVVDVNNIEANSDCSSETRSLSQSSIKSDDQKRKVMAEFRKIQQELFSVKANMSLVQAMNERLSRDLQLLVDKKNTHPLVRSESLRTRKNGSAIYANDVIDERQENFFVFPAIDSAAKNSHVKTASMQDVSTETDNYELEGSNILEKSEQEHERIESSTGESLASMQDVSTETDNYEMGENDILEKKSEQEHERIESSTIRTENANYELGQSDTLEKKSEQKHERIESSTGESLEKTPDEENAIGLEFVALYENGLDRKKQDDAMDVRKQLEKAMEELEDLRKDNREMKGQIDKIASSSIDHGDFLRRTTRFTSQMLKEMREREKKIERKTTKSVTKVSQPPLSLLGTRLNEITKAVDDMTKNSTPPPPESLYITKHFTSQSLEGKPAFMANPPAPPTQECAYITKHPTSTTQPDEGKPLYTAKQTTHPPPESVPAPRPQSAGSPTKQTTLTSLFSNKDKTAPKHATEQKRSLFTTGKLGEPSLKYGNVGRLGTEVGRRRPIEQLTKEWRSTETLSPRSSINGPLGYRDYIQRHIVMSSNAIAKIRDLTPEELNGQIIY